MKKGRKKAPLQNQKCSIAVFIKHGIVITGEGRITGMRTADGKKAILEVTFYRDLESPNV